jgi:hypothetical protein
MAYVASVIEEQLDDLKRAPQVRRHHEGRA